MDGVLPLFKPKGMTSHDCINQLRRIIGQRKIGHTGTLDPSAEGVLLICLGKATKIAQYMTEEQKAYEADMVLGVSTTTEDGDGQVVEKVSVHQPPEKAHLQSVLAQFVGESTQIPPMYSAVKVNGKKLYQYAREGVSVDRPERQITVYDLSLLADKVLMQDDTCHLSFQVTCQKGTFVRTLAVDIGRLLGYPAHLSQLTRTRTGPATLADCLTFANVEEMVAGGRLQTAVWSFGDVLSHLPSITVSDHVAERVAHGAVLPSSYGLENEKFTIYNEDNVLLAIYQQHPERSDKIKPTKVLI